MPSYCIEREISPRKNPGPSWESIEPEAEVVHEYSESICSGNVPVQLIHPTTPSAGDLHPERENQLDSAEAYR